ncbi:hypothetical protein QUF86_08335 [Peribacillus sp. NJ11]|uniref:hypothetical protein n=1 Tax=Peribacillus sp. NJ11 TaxID=3055861 RepID=UPI0025A2F0A2|nr:hypothetical protein [Peribacillus sp. NJ11]MDM5220760.1 hypothetical protein [Peribacillus sp. NJ11]
MAEAFKVRLWQHFYLSLIQARNKGSIPPDLHKALMNQVKQGLLRVMDVEVISAVRRDGQKSLQWGPGLYVTGALAELEMGPISRNISGARQAAERIVNSL